jgi:hypothetical protein
VTVTSEGTPPQPPPPEPPPVEPAFTTGVTVRPQTFDVEIYSSKVIEMEIVSSRDQTFTIDVGGIRSDWVEYNEQVTVEKGQHSEFIYLTPDQSGNYHATVSVRAKGENMEFPAVLDFYVSLPTEIPPVQAGPDMLSGFFIALSVNSFILALIIIGIFAAVIVYWGHKRLEYENEFIVTPEMETVPQEKHSQV